MRQSEQQGLVKREIDKTIERCLDEFDLTYYSLVGILDVIKSEVFENLMCEVTNKEGGKGGR